MKRTIASTMDGTLRLSLIREPFEGELLSFYYTLECDGVIQGHYATKRTGLRAYRELWHMHPMSEYERGLWQQRRAYVLVTLNTGKRLRVERGWQHTPYHTHYRVSARQVRGLMPEHIPNGVSLHIDVPRDRDCPHCSLHVHQVLRRN